MDKDTIDLAYIQEKFKEELPGEEAQLEMFTQGRKIRSEVLEKQGAFRESAVALVLFKKQQQIQCILIQRSEYDGAHSNQIAFPGGKKEKQDPSLKATAIRECIEEIGLNKQYFNYIGKLTHLYIPVSQFKVEPFVFYYSQPPSFIPNEREVKEIITFPIEQLFDEDILRKKDIQISEKLRLKDVPYFLINEKVVWGATAIVLNEIKHLLQ